MLPSLPLGRDSPLAAMGIFGSHAVALNLLPGGRSSPLRFEGESITWALQPSGVHLLQMYRRAASARCSSLGPVVAPVLWETCSWCPQVTLDFWLSEQTAAGQQGVKLSAHLLIRLEGSYSAHPHTGLCHVLSISSFLPLILSEC